MTNIEDLKLTKDMKYEALYWALGFESKDTNIFTKIINGFKITIDLKRQIATFDKELSIINGKFFKLNTHKSFVVLECVNKLLEMGYKPIEIIIDLDNEFDIYLKDIYIKCFEWNNIENKETLFNKNHIITVLYTSRLSSGNIERETIIKGKDNTNYKYGIFEGNKKDNYSLYNLEEIKSDDFIISGSKILKYIGKNTKVIVPDGITDLSSSLFWDNQKIEEAILPDSLVNIGGDTFYNCFNLRKVNIPKNVVSMGNNPFAGCPKVDIKNESENFVYDNGVLFNKDKTRLIYYSLKNNLKEYIVPDGIKIIGKHAFYLAETLEKIILPVSLIKLENNPFSGCKNLNLISKSSHYHVDNSVIYDKDYKSVVGVLNSISADYLVLKNVERICRNSFWNCKGIKKIILPRSLKDIGYNPFVGCDNIEFISKSKNYIVIDGILYNKDLSKLICCPKRKALGNFKVIDSTKTLERGAFSGCVEMASIDLNNVNVISKSCFTNCSKLSEVYCSNSVSFIGEWCFSHCYKLKSLSVSKKCFIDKNVLLNTNAILEIRN